MFGEERERERDRTCVRACVVRIGRGATASAKGEAEGTHIFERDAPWTLGLARRPRVGGERGRDIGRSAFVHARRKAAFTTRRGDCSRGSGSSGSSGAFENTAGSEGEVGRLVSD